ncbi:MAG: hypothetical protein F4X99_13770 [Gammaproteobacteria bacterium]|nr:hypothetical protein [Gammaproteobacteria bacterium]
MLEWLFKYPSDVYREAEFMFATGLAPAWWVLIGAVAVALLAASLLRLACLGGRLARWPVSRRLVVFGFQAATLGVILALLAEPTLVVRQLKSGANTVAVLIDDSESMSLDAGGGKSRLALARRLAAGDIVPGVGERSSVALFRFAEGARRIESLDALSADGNRTRLVTSLTEAVTTFNAEALAAVIVLTDGAANADAGDDLGALLAAGVPVHTVGIGPEANTGDVELSAVELPRTVPPGSEVTARLTLRHATAGDVRVRVRDGEAVLAARTVALRADGAVTSVDIAIPSGRPGLRELSFEIEPPPGDPLSRNDVRRRLLDVAERRHRVLHLEGEPRWEYKFLRRAVAEDDVMDIVSWLRTTPRKTYRQGVAGAEELAEGFPDELSKLYAYDVVVLGSLPAAALDDAQHAWLESFVGKRGGGLLALAGRDALADGGWDVAPLAKALPVTLKRGEKPTYRFVEGTAHPAVEGHASPVAALGAGESDGWAGLPRLADYQALGPPKPGATVLLEWVGEDTVAPLLIEQPYGFGRTAVLASATTWRWRMRTPPDDPRHGLFWRQLLRHLAQAAQQRDRVTVEGGPDALAVRLALRDQRYEPVAEADVRAKVTGPDGAAFEGTLAAGAARGAFEGLWRPGVPGVYRVDVTARAGGGEHLATRFARVGGEAVEYFGATLNRPLLERIAEATGGRYWEPGNVGGIARTVALEGAGVQERRALPLWDAPFFYVLIVLLKCLEWGLRRWWGSI